VDAVAQAAGAVLMRLFELPAAKEPLHVLCIGAHCDDIEIGCGATLMRWAEERPLEVTWVILCSDRERAAECEHSAQMLLDGARARRSVMHEFRDGFLPACWREAKESFEALKRLPTPHLIFTHERDDRHQDHRLVCELTWNTFRNHPILEYEVPKFDGGLGQPNLYVPIDRTAAERKAEHLITAYGSQRTKRWFTRDTFLSLMRLRGVECNASDGVAEAFHARKIVI
jgi:LmbE family N-acetylglucosaminyl deacetylase